MDPPEAADESCGALIRSWQSAVSELEALDGEIRELQSALREKTSRRRVMGTREAALRQLVESQCTPEDIAGVLDAAERAGERQGHAEPRVFEISAPPDAPDSEVEEEQQRVPSDGDRVSEVEGEGTDRCTSADFWEDSLDVVGVVKCGLCGLRFPLSDKPGLEAHYAECEAALLAQGKQSGGAASPLKAGRFTGPASSLPEGGEHDVLGPALY
uniref:Uncharacterized protein n=1 Tax=Alexandrium catenella TaxID=2925 RepID=A0A7S1RED5_ALECA|mmetsp:Transcript_53903/g.144376  ORF Transcript_53903/g.144376 Transcript_53903/m.144376 type:complete len:214 (+) Transcript_53903:68-709(+)